MQINNMTFFWASFCLYFLAMLSYTYRIATGNQKVAKIGKILLWIGFISQIVGFVLRWIESGHMPITGLYEYVTIFTWAIVGSYLIFDRWLSIPPSAGAITAFFGFLMIVIASLLPKEVSQQLVPALQSYWLNIHVSIAVLGEGAFFVAFLSAILYLIKQYDPKDESSSKIAWQFAQWVVSLFAGGVFLGVILKLTPLNLPEMKWAQILSFIAGMIILGLPFLWILAKLQPRIRPELPSLDILDTISYRAVTLGYPLFTFGAMIAGAIWAHQAWGSFWSWDPKEVGSALVWFVYTVYLHARYQRNWKGNRASVLAIIGFMLAILTLLGNMVLGGLHAYGVEDLT
jgi:cytochrome c-type biogenesis protein CcsB